jgi:hypothetical protein
MTFFLLVLPLASAVLVSSVRFMVISGVTWCCRARDASCTQQSHRNCSDTFQSGIALEQAEETEEENRDKEREL